MKSNIKALELIEKGLTAKTVSKLTESQIETLHKKIFILEQVTEVPGKKTYKVGPKGGKVGNVMVSTDPNTKEVMVTTETEMTESDLAEDMNINLTNDPDATDDGMGIFEKEEEDNKPNPWAICHSQVGPKKSRKWERCVREVKKQLGEGKNPVSLFLENEIMKIVERNLPPRITKGDLIKYLTESGPATAPSKPKTSPTTKPGKPDIKPRPSHPGKNPNPGEKESPKAKKETTENSPAVAPSKPKTSPTTKPGKPDIKPRPSHPGKNPNPGEKESPKAEKAKEKVIDLIINLLQK